MMRVEKAIYHAAILPEHQGNLLIEALPIKKDWAELMEAFSYYPDYAEEIAQHPDPLVREEYLNRIKELRQPLHEYFDCFRAIERAIKNGYSTKNPLTPTTAQYLHYPVDERPDIEPRTGFFQPKADGLTLVGESGVGKTSMLEQILGYFPNVIEHSEYKGLKLNFSKQVVWIKVDCPNNSSVRDLCEEILSSLDLSLEREKTKPAATIGSLVRQIEQNIKSSFLGILVIDEMQRLVFKRTGGENNLLNFLHSLVNKLGVPLFFCANPPFDATLARTLKAARRAESGGYFTMDLLKQESDSWIAFINQLWQYQWTNVYTELTEELNNKIYQLSAGNLDIAHRTYRESQRLLIGKSDERITIATLEMGYSIACGLSSRTNEMVTAKIKMALPEGRKRKIVATSEIRVIDVDNSGDITKIQHPEFACKLKETLGAVDLHERIVNPDLFQQIQEIDNPTSFLKQQDLLLDAPLNYLS